MRCYVTTDSRFPGKKVLFEEFCVWYTKKHEPSRDIATSADKFKATRKRSKKKAGARKNGRVSAAEHDNMPDFDSKKFDALEKQFMAVLVDDAKLDQMWDRLDFNDNQLVSLAEIDKLVVERYPLLNNKPALMRAYKQTTLKDGGDGDAWVEPKEFPQLLSNLFYFNKLFQAFTGLDTDNDRRLDFTEFKQGLDTLGMTIDEKEAQEEFDQMDSNDGGIVRGNFDIIYLGPFLAFLPALCRPLACRATCPSKHPCVWTTDWCLQCDVMLRLIHVFRKGLVRRILRLVHQETRAVSRHRDLCRQVQGDPQAE
jgi:hypothetical protein